MSCAYNLTSRVTNPGRTVVECGGVRFGGRAIVLIAGPCAVESLEALRQSALAARAAGAAMLRGGAWKPRSSPYSFQGLGALALEHLAAARTQTGLPFVVEVMAPDQVELAAARADMLQIGTRNMSNFPLLQEAGRQPKPVLLKRGMMSTIEEWLLAAEYIMAHGNPNVVLCERGIRTFEPQTRFTLDVSAIPAVRELTHLPVIVDPSHAAGRRELVIPLAAAAIAAGADGLLVETHPTPATALCDGAQSLAPGQLAELAQRASAVAAAEGRTLHLPPGMEREAGLSDRAAGAPG